MSIDLKGLVRAESLEGSVFFMTLAEAGWRSNSNFSARRGGHQPFLLLF